MLKSHEALKDHIGCEMSPELNQHLRRYLEFLRMIRPVSYNNPYVVAFNNYNYIRGSNNATDCLGGAGNFAYSRAMGHYIISLIGMLEKVIDFHSNSEPASFKDADFMV
ncbi:hypothetical protein CANMA_003264 [Candida margitis]|uniref:uncharacterized protein n=1 Tax=Candida margitis TaxID=1775924 RepID=UPI002226F79C|nr:uncharacterized protein CANMA_003264 [Candida margitis]KAI5967207.1 hypothetical protein CANMA_003264 [Candida margitis]